jgi:hypothetical protein
LVVGSVGSGYCFSLLHSLTAPRGYLKGIQGRGLGFG